MKAGHRDDLERVVIEFRSAPIVHTYQGYLERNRGDEVMNRAKSRLCPAIALGDGGSIEPG